MGEEISSSILQAVLRYIEGTKSDLQLTRAEHVISFLEEKVDEGDHPADYAAAIQAAVATLVGGTIASLLHQLAQAFPQNISLLELGHTNPIWAKITNEALIQVGELQAEQQDN